MNIRLGALLVVAMLSLFLVRPAGTHAQAFDLTGLWQDNSSPAAYRLRQVDNRLYWSADGGTGRYYNLFSGEITGTLISGAWLDLPGSPNLGGGSLTLRIESNDRLVKVEDTPCCYGAQEWTRQRSGTPRPSTVPLKLFWSSARGDNFTTATAQGEADALGSGYSFARIEGYVFTDAQPGTAPLKLFWSSARGDNFTTATAQGETAALNAGYVFVRIEGYVFVDPQPGTVPLKLFWSSAREDNFTTPTLQGEADALSAGYGFARIEGYVYPSP